MKKLIAIVLALLCLSSCAAGIIIDDPTATKTQSVISDTDYKPISAKRLSAEPKLGAGTATDETFKSVYAAFADKLFSRLADGTENVMISPLSVMLALGMVANGADGNTLAEMEAVLGGELTLAELNEYLLGYVNSLTSSDKAKLKVSNSIWVANGRMNANPEFIGFNARYYGAEIYEAPFDGDTVKDINGWVKNKTDGMINKVIEELSPEVVMLLINAICFDGKWSENFETNGYESDFRNADGSVTKTKLMNDDTSTYIETDKSEGFMKYYSGSRYAFVAMLPKDGYGIGDIIRTNAQELVETAKWGSKYQLNLHFPKFEAEYEKSLVDTLKALGMNDAFGSSADFTRLGTSPVGNIYIGDVFHKTYISLDEAGTKAAAVTVVIPKAESCAPHEEIKNLTFDRPFVYYIVDTATGSPIFMGTMVKLK